MSVALAVALLALLVALFTLVALVAVYARVRGLEAAGDAGVTGYPALVGRLRRRRCGPAPVRGAASSRSSTATARSAPPSSRRSPPCTPQARVHVVALTDRIAGAADDAGRGDPPRRRRGAGRPVRGLRTHGARGRRRRHRRRPAVRLRRHRSGRAVARARRSRPDPRERGEPRMNAIPDIPSTSAAPEQPRPSAVVARLRGYRPSRRTVLRALVLGAAATTLVPLGLVPVAPPGLRGRRRTAPSTAPASPPPTTRRPTTGGRAARRSATAAGSAAPTRARTATTARARTAPVAWTTSRRG